MSDAVAIEVTSQGRTIRFGHDVPDARGIPFGLTYSSTMPGGHATCSFNLRVPIIEEASFGLLDLVRVYAVKGNVTLWDGMVSRLPRQSGDDVLLQVQCVGRSAEMSWQTGFREVYVDGDLAAFGPPSRTRQHALLGAGFAYPLEIGVSVEPDGVGGLPALTQRLSSIAVDAGAGKLAICEALLQSPVPIGVVYYDQSQYDKGGGGVQLPNANWVVRLGSAADDDLAGNTSTGDLAGAASAAYYTVAFDDHRVVFVQVRWESGTLTADGEWRVDWRALVRYGTHGLTRRGADPGGFYGHELLADIISRAAPGLTYTTGPGGSIEDNTSFVVEQLTFPKPTTAADALLELNKYFLWEWGVWDDGEFFWRPTDPDRLCWEARLDEGVQLQLEGDEADNALNGVIVNYRLPDGTEKVAGPIGSGFDVENAVLGDASVDNTVNERGIARKWAQLDLSFPTSDDGAVQIGFVYLAQLSFPARKGQITVTGTVKHPTKGRRPVGELRAGDWIKVPGHSDVARRIVQASHTPDKRECTLDVGNDVDKADAILQRLGVRTSRVTG